jgi:hypothetical protein
MRFFLAILAWLACSSCAFAELPDGVRTILLHPAKGDPVRLGQVEFAGDGATRSFTLSLDQSLFRDHFLSMRPFKCVEGPEKLYCHLPYPYLTKRVISAEDLVDLEYALLFVQKDPQDYGINLWNGILYKLDLTGGGRIDGTLHDIDMDLLAVPPAEGELRPIKHSDASPSAPEANWLPRLTIE